MMFEASIIASHCEYILNGGEATFLEGLDGTKMQKWTILSIEVFAFEELDYYILIDSEMSYYLCQNIQIYEYKSHGRK
jgi:hypothetical protein